MSKRPRGRPCKAQTDALDEDITTEKCIMKYENKLDTVPITKVRQGTRFSPRDDILAELNAALASSDTESPAHHHLEIVKMEFLRYTDGRHQSLIKDLMATRNPPPLQNMAVAAKKTTNYAGTMPLYICTWTRCGELFVTLIKLKNHLKEIHNCSFVCPMCHACFCCNSALQTHINNNKINTTHKEPIHCELGIEEFMKIVNEKRPCVAFRDTYIQV